METPILVAVLSIICNLIFGVIGYLMRDKINTLTSGLNRAKEDITDIQVNYVQKVDMEKMENRLIARFDRLEDKLDKAR